MLYKGFYKDGIETRDPGLIDITKMLFYVKGR